MGESSHNVAVFKGLVLLAQGVLLWIVLAVMTSVPGAGFEGSEVARIVESVQIVEMWYLYRGLQYGAAAMAVGGPVWYWVVYPVYRFLKGTLEGGHDEQVSFE